MNIRLRPDTEEWLRAQVAEGRFKSIEDAVEMLVVDARLNQSILDSQDWSWAKPYIDEGLAALEAGDVIPADEVYAELRARFSRSKES
jgi:predicted transcriptional regulator